MNNEIKNITFFGINTIKKIHKNNTIKYIFCRITFYKIKCNGNKTIYTVLGIPFCKIRIKNDVKKIYLFGIPVYKANIKIATKNVIIRTREYVLLREQQPKELLIVNTDSIGDYILCRNFFAEIKKSEKYKEYKISLLGCSKYKDFAEYLDCDIIDNFYWVRERPQSLSETDLEQERCALHNEQGLKHYYDTIIFPSANSMDKRLAHERLVSGILCNNKVIFCFGINPHRNCSDLLNYTSVCVNYNTEKFEFDLNKYFYEDLLEREITIDNPFIENEKVLFSNNYLKNKKREYIVINPCAYDKYRMWHIHNWQRLIVYIQEIEKYDIVIVCSKNEENYCKRLITEANIENVDILAGLSVKDLLATLKLAKLYIGQDSGVFHIAAALNIRCLCLSAGNAYFRFMNYPQNRKHVKILFPKGTEDWIKNNKDRFPDLVRNINCFYINSLKVGDVQKEVHNLLLLKDIIFVSKLRTVNTGDLEISAYDYFRAFFDNYVTQKFDNDDMAYLQFKKAIFILGGRGLINQNNQWNEWINQLVHKNKVIGWGIGFNQHIGKDISVNVNLDKFSLLGLRDYNCNYRYVPCVSCLKEVFHTNKKIIRKIGCIAHWEYTERLFDIPTMYNNQPFDELINFIKETEVIITNTYHIMYWSTLLGKKVILFGIFSNKFDHFKYSPILYSGNLEHDMAKAQTYPKALQECKRLNLAFFEDVKKILEQ